MEISRAPMEICVCLKFSTGCRGDPSERESEQEEKEGKKIWRKGCSESKQRRNQEESQRSIIPDAGKSQRTSLGAKEKQRCGI